MSGRVEDSQPKTGRADVLRARALENALTFRQWVKADTDRRITDERRNQLIGGYLALEALIDWFDSLNEDSDGS